MNVVCAQCDATFVVTRAVGSANVQTVPCPNCGEICALEGGHAQQDASEEASEEAGRQRKATVTEGPHARDELARTRERQVLPPLGAELDLPDADDLLLDGELVEALEPVAPIDLEYEPTPRAGFVPPTIKLDAVDAPSIRLRPDVAMRERNGTTSRDLPVVASPSRQAAAASPTATFAVHDTDVTRARLAFSSAPPLQDNSSGLTWIVVAVVAVLVAVLGGGAAWFLSQSSESEPEAERTSAPAVVAVSDDWEAANPVAVPGPALAVERVAESAPEPTPAEAEPEPAAEPAAEPGPAPAPEPAPEPTPAEAEPEPAPEPAAEPAPRATHRVAGTAADHDAPYLALRDAPKSESEQIGQMADDTQLRLLSSRGRWVRVEVVDGPLRGQIGWAHRRWITER